MRTVYEFSVKDRKGKEVSLKEYANEVLLIVNTATKCGFTPQYEELEKLYETYHQQGFEILDFPCNQFGQQAPGTDESIHQFCKLTYGTEFQRYKKIKVNGDNAAPLFKFLKECKGFAGWDETHPLYPVLDKMLSEILTTRKAQTSSGTSPSSSLTRRVRWWLASNLLPALTLSQRPSKSGFKHKNKNKSQLTFL